MSADHNLDERIENRLSASTLKKYHVKVSVTNSVATLTGSVADGSRASQSDQLATIKGISRVDNQLIVDLSAPTGTDRHDEEREPRRPRKAPRSSPTRPRKG